MKHEKELLALPVPACPDLPQKPKEQIDKYKSREYIRYHAEIISFDDGDTLAVTTFDVGGTAEKRFFQNDKQYGMQVFKNEPYVWGKERVPEKLYECSVDSQYHKLIPSWWSDSTQVMYSTAASAESVYRFLGKSAENGESLVLLVQRQMDIRKAKIDARDSKKRDALTAAFAGVSPDIPKEFEDCSKAIVHRKRTINRSQDAPLLVEGDEGCRLGVIHLKAAQDGFRLVILTLNEVGTAAFTLGCPVQRADMVGPAAAQAYAPAGEAVNQLLIFDLNIDDLVNLSEFRECLSLSHGPRESIQDISVLAVRLFQSLFDDVNHNRIRNQIAAVDVGLGGQTCRRSLFHCPAQNVSSGDLRDAQPLANANGLGSLSCTRRAKENDVHNVYLNL